MDDAIQHWADQMLKMLKKISKTIYKMVILFIMVPVFFNDEIVFY